MGNRQRILNAAIELMNEKGSAVGTTLLSDHLDISPGNLYYHFKNREEILGEILEHLAKDLDLILALEADEEVSPKKTASCFIGGVYVLWRYRFFFSSSVEIVVNDDELRVRYRQIYEDGIASITAIIKALCDQNPGGLPLSADEQQRLAKNIWIVWTGWPKYTEVMSGRKPSREAVLSSHEQLVFLWKPYIDAKFYASVRRWAKKLLEQPELIPGYRSEFNDG